MRGDDVFEIDPRISIPEIAALLVGKLVGLTRSLPWHLTARPSFPVFRERHARIRTGSRVKIGRGTIIGRDAMLDARYGEQLVIGQGSTIGPRAQIQLSGAIRSPGGSIHIGNRVGIGASNFIGGQGGVSIGDDTLLGPFVMVFSEDHLFTEPVGPVRAQGEVRRPVSIGSGCWIGANTVVLSGTTIGDGTVIGAGSIVRGDIPAGVLAVGNPIHVVRSI
jgi:acetyltransferase-like isoleucine patch superfamily enzyme